MVGEVGVEPTKPEAMRLQRTPVSDLVLSRLNDPQSLFTLVPCYLVVWVGDVFEFLSPLEPLKLYEGVARDNWIEQLSENS